MRRLLDGDDAPRRRRLMALLIVLLVVVDAALVGWALLAARGGASSDAQPAPVSLSPAPSPTTETPSPSPDPEPSPTETAAVGTRLLAVGGQGVLWRAELGSCEAGGGLVQVSTDAGATWGDVTPGGPAIAAVRTIITGPSAAQASIVYADEACALTAQRTFDGGGGWQENLAALSVASYVAQDASIVLAGTAAPAPCEDARQVRGPSAVLCADGLYVGSAAGWSQPVQGVVAIAPYDEQRVVAASLDDAECAGVSVSFVSVSDGSRSAVACAEVETGGDVAIGVGGTTAWVWSGDETASVSLV